MFVSAVKFAKYTLMHSGVKAVLVGFIM